MMIEIRKAGFANKGAELMLLSVLKAVGDRFPKAKFVMAPNNMSAPYKQRAVLGLYQKVWLHRYRLQWGYLGILLPKYIRDLFGLVLDSEIDVVLDASGFSYSDQIGTVGISAASRALKKWKNNGTKVIFLPQAFGPFKNKSSIDSIKYIIKNADLIFPRDIVSYKYLIDICDDTKNIHLAPDFTCLLNGTIDDKFDSKLHQFCIIPNSRMIEKTSKKEADNYIIFMANCCKHLYRIKQNPFILIHEENNDYFIGNEIVSQSNLKMDIIKQTDPLKIKGLISQCSGVISSRYHGLISALSQGIPALATGWSHKYEMLFSDYDFSDGIISVLASDSEIKNKIESITNQESKNILIQKLKNKAEKQKENTNIMWNMVFSVIQNT
jgi:colanic acid/amylovoran biosynthesis protein